MTHLDPTLVDHWLAALADDEGSRDLLRHLLDCASCAARVQAQLKTLPAPQTGERIDYSPIWPRVLDRARSAETRARRIQGRAFERLEELLATPLPSRFERVHRERRFAHQVIAEEALAHIRARPEYREDLARIALAVLERLPERESLRAVRIGLLAAARCHLAEALRCQGLLDRAEHELERIGLPTEMSDALERAHYCRVLGAVRRDRGRLDEALALFSRAIELYEDLREIEALAEVRLALGALHLDLLDARRAQLAFENVLRIPESLPSRLTYRAVKGRVLSFLLSDGPEVALGALDEASTTTPGMAESPEVFALLALRGRIELETGDAESASPTLTKAFQGLLESGALLEAAQAGAGLALLFLRGHGVVADRLDLAESLDLLSTHGVPFELELSLVALRDGLRQGSLPPRRLRQVLAAIERHRDLDPSRHSPRGNRVVH